MSSRLHRCRASVLSLVLLAGLSRSVQADEPSLTAQVSASEIGLDETLQLTITLGRDAHQPYRGYSRPDFQDFELLHQRQAESTQWSLVGGQQTVRTIEEHIYLLRPKHLGLCLIPGTSARLGTREVHTQPIKIRVHPAGKRLPGNLPQPSAGLDLPAPPSPEAMTGDEDLYLEAQVDHTTVYVGQAVVVAWRIYTQTDILHYRATAQPHHDDFWSEDLFVPQGPLELDRVEVKGRVYRAALLLKRALFPLRSGKLTITPLEVEATTVQTAFYPRGSATRQAQPIDIEVLALPAGDRPSGFSPSNVGRFDLETSVDRATVGLGESLTLRVAVRGEGNIRQVRVPPLGRIDGFRVYQPSSSERIDKRDDRISGERVYTYLLVPERGGELIIPAVALGYFDPMEKRYGYAKSHPISVEVSGDTQPHGPPKAGETQENVLGTRIRPLRNRHHLSSRLGEHVLRGPLLMVALAMPPALVLTALAGISVRSLLRRDTKRRKRRRARAAARQRLRRAEGHIKGQQPSAFFSECSRVIYEHLEFRLGVKCESLTLAALRQLLIERGLDTGLSEELVRELETADFARFAPSASGAGEMRAALRRVRQLLGRIEQSRIPMAMEADV